MFLSNDHRNLTAPLHATHAVSELNGRNRMEPLPDPVQNLKNIKVSIDNTDKKKALFRGAFTRVRAKQSANDFDFPLGEVGVIWYVLTWAETEPACSSTVVSTRCVNTRRCTCAVHGIAG